MWPKNEEKPFSTCLKPIPPRYCGYVPENCIWDTYSTTSAEARLLFHVCPKKPVPFEKLCASYYLVFCVEFISNFGGLADDNAA